MSSLSFVLWTFDWDGVIGFVWRGRYKDWGAVTPQGTVLSKNLISRQMMGYFNTLDLTQIFH